MKRTLKRVLASVVALLFFSVGIPAIASAKDEPCGPGGSCPGGRVCSKGMCIKSAKIEPVKPKPKPKPVKPVKPPKRPGRL